MSGTADYLYAISRPIGAGALTAVRGIGGTPVRAVHGAGLDGLVSTVELDEFGEEPLRRNLEDLTWLVRTARAHDAVVHAVAEQVTTAPLRLGTICLDDSAVVVRLSEIAPRASALLDRLDGRIEWGVKLYAAAAPATPPATAASSGTDYLLARRDQAQRRDAATVAAAEHADAVYRGLAAMAVAGRRHRPQDPHLSGTDAPMLLNAAYLLDAARAGDFHDAVERLVGRDDAYRVEITGPWPPYSFAGLDES